jgi:hypothetical protein
MLKGTLALSSAFLFAVSLATLAWAQGAAKPDEAKSARWEGVVVRIDKDHSILTVRKVSPAVEKDIHFDSSTRFESQHHASKEITQIDVSQINEEDRVICIGNYLPNGDFHANLISKRLSHSPK